MSLIYDKTYSLRTHNDIFYKAQEVLEAKNTNIARALNLFLKNVAVTGEIGLLDEDELLVRQLQAEIAESVAEYKRGEYATAEEVRERFGI